MVIAVMLGVAVRLLSNVRVPWLAWISMIARVAVGVLDIVIAVTTAPSSGAAGGVLSPLSVVTLVLPWAYLLGVLVTLAGAVICIL
ncbi:hypothetical protein [Lacisediminihabitans sp.]|jgi:hypothetical protein|uniref:hypothetical protein n=1 Tax=Lacisediminihabitans sp. TaxID=2787631 RepID=UPI002F92873B